MARGVGSKRTLIDIDMAPLNNISLFSQVPCLYAAPMNVQLSAAPADAQTIDPKYCHGRLIDP